MNKIEETMLAHKTQARKGIVKGLGKGESTYQLPLLPQSTHRTYVLFYI